MNHKIKIGKPVIKNDKVIGYDDVQEIASNQIFNWNKRGYKAIPEGEEPKAVVKKTAPDPADSDQDLNDLTVKELREIAKPLGVTGKTKAVLISAIEEAQQAPDPE